MKPTDTARTEREPYIPSWSLAKNRSHKWQRGHILVDMLIAAVFIWMLLWVGWLLLLRSVLHLASGA